MIPEPEIVMASRRLLAGHSIELSLSLNLTAQVWQSFMPVRRKLIDTVGSDLYSVNIYPKAYFSQFDPARTFTKWAAVEVPETVDVPPEFEKLEIPAGLYAVFTYKGRSSDAAPFFNHIFMDWLPRSGYQLADRPHFEVLGTRYRKDDPASEETVWIPIEPASDF